MNDVIEMHEPIHDWFGLTYSSYLVLSRTLMQAMPVEWQDRAVKLFEELCDATEGVAQPDHYIVKAARKKEIAEMSEAEHLLAGTSTSEMNKTEDSREDDADLTYFDEHGSDVDRDYRVLIPTDDPIPHYRSCEARRLRLGTEASR